MQRKVVSYRYTILFILIILFANGYSQTNYFNNRYELTPFKAWDFSTTVIEISNGYIVLGETGGEYNWRTRVLTKIDFSGNVEWIKTTGDTTSEWSIGYPGSLIKAIGPFYYSTGLHRSYTSDWLHDRGIVIKYTTDFDTLWRKEYGEISEPFDTAYLFRNLKQTSEGGIIITGGRLPNSTGIMNASAYLLKTDSSGNKQWEKTFTNLGGDTQGFSVIQTSDGGYAIGAFQYYHVAPPNETGDPIVIKTDSQGNQEWMRNLGGPLMDTQSMITNSDDGNIFVLSAYSDSVVSQDEWAKKIHITKLSNNNTVLFDRFYKRTLYSLWPQNIISNPDGSIVATGATGTLLSEYPHLAGWIFKTDNNGDSLWYREYNLVNGNESHNFPLDIKQTSDNGYITCGYVNPIYPDTGTQDVWVLKVDSLGCESPSYCWVGINEQKINKISDELSVWPNPSNNNFSVRFISNNKQKSKELKCYSLEGQEIMRRIIPAGQQSAAVDCESWKAGMYILQITEDGVVVGREKVVKR